MLTYSLFGYVFCQFFDGFWELRLQMFSLFHDTHGFVDFYNFLFKIWIIEITQRIYEQNR